MTRSSRGPLGRPFGGGFAITAVVAFVPLVALGQPTRPFWGSYGRNAQHTALADVAARPLGHVRWRMRVDLKPRYDGTALLIHYGSPLVTQANTVIVPVKARATDGFRVVAVRGADGTPIWWDSSNYRLPPHDWTPSFSPVLSPSGALWMPAAGGTLIRRTDVDVGRHARPQQIAFYGIDAYRRNPRPYLANVFVNTPLTSDDAGNVFFGFQVTGPTPLGLAGGIARVSDDGTGTWVGAATASGDPTMTKVAHNSAPALGNDGRTLYVAVTGGDGTGVGPGYLLALDSRTLATVAVRRLTDPQSGQDALVHDDGSASPTVGPDGDVYFGVLENPFPFNHGRGWLLHFDAALEPRGVPGAFGWDDTASIVPASAVPSYRGTAAYLLFTKYNDYVEAGGDGVNRIALLDPDDQMTDPVSATPVMREVLTVAGPTPDAEFVALWPGAVREWCINSAVVDPLTRSVLANDEDGKLYRWSLVTGALTESVVLTAGIGEAYTPTLLGPDGTAYAINDATLFAVGQ